MNLEVFLTEKDPDIEKSIQKDPLREQAIWTILARKLYPHINSVNDDIKGFIITSLGLDIFDEMQSKNNYTNQDKNEILIMYEMIIMYMLVEYNLNNKTNITFSGDVKAKDYYEDNNHNPIINMSDENHNNILTSQERLGYIGRYKSNTTGIKDDILKIAFNKSELQSVKEFFIKKLDNRNNDNNYKDIFNSNKEIKKLLYKVLIDDPHLHKEAYLQILGIKKNGSIHLNKIYETITSKNKEVTPPVIFESCKNTNLINNIIVLEHFLASLNNVFYKLLNLNSNDFKDKDKLNSKLEDSIEHLKRNMKEYQKSFKKIDEEEMEVNKKINENYKELLSCINSNQEDIAIVKAIIKSHQKLFESQKLTPWIKIDENNNDKVIINHRANRTDTNDDWEHTYYIDAVKKIIEGMTIKNDK